MASATWELQKAVFGALSANTPLTALLGGGRIYDDVPRGAAFPYVTFGPVTTRDWSTGTDEGSEHLVTLHVWSRGAGEREVHTIAAAVRAVLHDATLSLSGFRLVNLRHEATDAAREADGETYRGVMRLRAVIEQTG